MEKELLNILEKVSILYQKYGIKSITMDDVAREFGISKKTLYQYVTDKPDLVEKVMLLIAEKHNSFFKKLRAKKINAIEELFEVNKYFTEMLKNYNPSMEYDLRKYYPDLFKKIYDVRRKRMYESIIRNMKKGIKEGLYRRDMDIEIIAKLHVSRIENMYDNEIFTNEELISTKVFNEIFIYHLRGIANVTGIKFLERKLKELKSKNNE